MGTKGFISPTEYAKFIGKSDQTVYNMIKAGMLSVEQVVRGNSVGYIIEKPTGFDAWKAEQC